MNRLMRRTEVMVAAGYRAPKWIAAVQPTEQQLAAGFDQAFEADPGEVYPIYLAELADAGITTHGAGTNQLALEVARLLATRDLKLWFGPLAIRWKRNPAVALEGAAPGPALSAQAATSLIWRELVSYRVGREVTSPDDAWVPPDSWVEQGVA